MRSRIKYISENAMIAAIYIVLTVFIPTSFTALNIRLADFVPPIAIINRKYRAGVTVGMILANCFSPFGFVDVIVAAAICLICFFLIPQSLPVWLRSILLVLITSLIVSVEIAIITNVPFIYVVIGMIISQSIMTFAGVIIMGAISRLVDHVQ